MPAPSSHVVARAAWRCALLGLTLLGCGSKSSVIPATLAGQLPKDFQLGRGRGVIVARFTVTTDGEPGFGGISNPLLVEFREVGVDPPDANPQGLSLPHPGARVWGSARELPTLWQYEKPGLMAASFRPGSYDGLVMAYPDTSESSVMPDSIPAPTQGLRFAPIEIVADEVVYIGNIRIDQRYGFWDMALDRVHVDFSVSDDYDRSVADFRARYPQLAETPVHKRLAKVVPTAP